MRIDEILDILGAGGAQVYFGEPVSQLEHALQTAALAEQEGASDALVVAALLHDVGHLVPGEDRDVAHLGVDARHEELGGEWLRSHFGDEVTEPIRLHVAAKRYLCAVDPSYGASLSAASWQSLALQGGAMTEEEARAFERGPWAQSATALRRWDDRAKAPGVLVPDLDHYRDRIARMMVAP